MISGAGKPGQRPAATSLPGEMSGARHFTVPLCRNEDHRSAQHGCWQDDPMAKIETTAGCVTMTLKAAGLRQGDSVA
jgi:hypothetical protein